MEEVQELLEKALDRCEALEAAAAEARRLRDHHQHRWYVLDQERESLQKVVLQAQTSERSARQAERAALEGVASWRRWLASFLDLLLRRGASGPLQAADVSKSQIILSRHPEVHALIASLSEAADVPSVQADLLGRLPSLYERVSGLISEGFLQVSWSDVVDAAGVDAARDVAAPEVAKVGLRSLDAGRVAELEVAAERTAHVEKLLAQKEIAVAGLEHERRALRGEIRRLQNYVQELRGSVRVFCRLRPPRRPLEGHLASAGIGAQAESGQRVVLRKPPGDRRHDFGFDRVFCAEASQEDLYEEVAPLLPAVLEGMHLCIFAYGQTGAGKTYTLSGDFSRGEKGIQDLAIVDLLRLAATRGGSAQGAEAEIGEFAYDVRISALEIYNETIHDLLEVHEGAAVATPLRAAGSFAGLDLRQSREAGLGDAFEGSLDTASVATSPFGSMCVPGLRSWAVRGLADVESALRCVRENRHVSATALNERSSRSHCVLSLSFASPGDATGVLHIVDLAGSERTKISQAEGQQLKEANCINRSLSSLADVLYALGDTQAGGTHVPYRNSKLTHLLRDALGGVGGRTLLFAQVSPDPTDAHESYSTLAFASRVASVQKGRLRLPAACRGLQPPRTPLGSVGRHGGSSAALSGSVPPLPGRAPEALEVSPAPGLTSPAKLAVAAGLGRAGRRPRGGAGSLTGLPGAGA